MYRELIDTMSVLAARMDVLTSTVVQHRTWVSRLQGIGVLMDSSAMLTCSGVLLRSTGIAWDLRARYHHTTDTPSEGRTSVGDVEQLVCTSHGMLPPLTAHAPIHSTYCVEVWCIVQ